ncbi:hypothetical protein BC833DRAFT_594432 [Globomyces pollinis-pini]|nr:hypothetical protein BC833DRAFT_594432 [Globomyces pollinis-pini]
MLSPNFKNCSLSFEEAIKDTPAFRQGVILFSEELDEISKWSDSVSKTFKTYVEDYNRFNETFMSLSKKFSSNKFPCLIDPQILNPIAVSMMTFSTLQMKSLESLQETFTTNMTSIQSFLNQIKDIKETRKQMDKAMEKYDSSLLKYAGFSKTRDPSTFTEHQYSLNEFKKQYNLLAIDFVQKCMCLKLSVDPLVTSKIFPPLSEFLLFYEENLQIMNGLTTVAKEFEKSLAEESETLNVATVQSMATKWKENCIDKLARDESKGKIDSLSLTIDTALEKEGYLFRKVDQKWYRRYFSIRNGFFEAQSVKTPSMSGPLNVLLCNVKQNTTEDRRYCFEVATHSETYLLQAQSEKEMDSWIKVFENAKKHETLPDDQLEIDSSSKATSMSELQLDVKIDEADTDLRPIVQPSDKPILYADTALQKKNVELHALLKSVPPTDIVLDVFSTALQRDLLLQGKLFVTQNRLCFYSNILGFVNIVVIFLQDISDICQKVGSLHTTVTITTTTGVSYIFKAYSKVDRSFTILNIVWKNSLSENPVTPQELLDQCNFIAMDRSKTLHRFDTDKEKLLSPGLVQSPSDFIASETYSWSLPASIPVPLGPLECGCKTHLEKIENSIIVPVSVKELHETLFGSLQSEWNDFFDKQRSITNRVESAWTNDELPSQTIEFVLPVNNPMLKMKELKLYETKVYLKKEDYLVYVVEVKGTTPDAPFGDCFSTNTRYCLTWNTSDTSRLSGSTELIFCKSTMMKSIIRANAAKAMSDSFATLQSDLVTFLKQKKGSSSSATDLEWVLPDSIIPPVGEVVCGCASHLSKVESDILLQAPVSKVYETLFGSLCGPFWAAFDKKRGITRNIQI